MADGVKVKGCVGEEARLGRNVWGGRLPVVWGVKIIDEKNREMGGPLALDGRHLMWGHNNQLKVVVNSEGGVGEETRPGRKRVGDVFPLFGVSNGAAKNKNKKYIVALNGRRLMIYYAATNQKQASRTEGGMKERCNGRETQKKHYAIVLGALLVNRRLKI
jgi:hypothetical protein